MCAAGGHDLRVNMLAIPTQRLKIQADRHDSRAIAMVHFMYFNQLPTKDLDAIKSALMGRAWILTILRLQSVCPGAGLKTSSMKRLECFSFQTEPASECLAGGLDRGV